MSAVLAVVLMVLKIIGMILLALLLLLLLALLLPAGIHFRWSYIGGLRLQLCYGPLHFTLYPRKADEEEKKAEPKAETKQGNTPKTELTSAAPPKPTPPPAKAELPAQPTMEKQTEPTEAKPAKAPEEPQKAEPAPPAEKELGKPKAPETSPQPEQAVPKLPRQRKHLPRNHSRKKIPALWTASKRQSGRTLLAMCGTCSACCAPVWGRCCAASASAS